MLMLKSVLPLLHLTVVWVAAATDSPPFYKGEICKQSETGQLWTCKPLGDCPKAQEGQKRVENTAQLCNSEASETIVCCEPDVQPPVVGTKSKNMCKQYSESVYKTIPDPITGEPLKIDTCRQKDLSHILIPTDEIGKQPHVAQIGYGTKPNIQWACSGTLISERFVLAAAHCISNNVKKTANWVKLGEHRGDTKKEWVEYDIVERIVHPDYEISRRGNDIALLKLNKDVEFTEYIRPICLQTDHQFPNASVTVVGYLRPDHGDENARLYKTDTKTISRKLCNDSFNGLLTSRLLKDGIDDKSMVCAGEINLREICDYLSGSPLQVELKEPYCMVSQIGITAFGAPCSADKPTVYTRVSHYVPWIESIVWP